jgi:hypothetical protein
LKAYLITTSEKTMTMMANMKIATIVEATFSMAPSAFRHDLITLVLRYAGQARDVPQTLRMSWGGDCGNGGIIFPQGVASVLATGVQTIGPDLGDAFEQILEFRANFRL